MLQQTAATQDFFTFCLACSYPSCSGCPCILPAFPTPAISSLLPFPPTSPAQSSHTALAMTLTYKTPSKSILSSPTRPDNTLELALWPFPAMMPLGSPLRSAGALSPQQLHCIIFIAPQFLSFLVLGTFFPPNQCMEVPAVGLLSPITEKSCVKSFRFLTPVCMSLYKIICLPTSYKWEAVVLQEETTWGLSLRDKVHFTVNNTMQVALGRCRRWYDLCQLFEQNLPTPINTLVLRVLFCYGNILVVVEAIDLHTETQ